jgi:hypothetical protein
MHCRAPDNTVRDRPAGATAQKVGGSNHHGDDMVASMLQLAARLLWPRAVVTARAAGGSAPGDCEGVHGVVGVDVAVPDLHPEVVVDRQCRRSYFAHRLLGELGDRHTRRSPSLVADLGEEVTHNALGLHGGRSLVTQAW